VVGRVLESKVANCGFDAQKEVYGDMIKAAIIDPAKVVRSALQDRPRSPG
jgi:chaperonin GroEL